MYHHIQYSGIINILRSGTRVPGYHQHNQIWYPGTPEYYTKLYVKISLQPSDRSTPTVDRCEILCRICSVHIPSRETCPRRSRRLHSFPTRKHEARSYESGVDMPCKDLARSSDTGIDCPSEVHHEKQEHTFGFKNIL